MVHITVMPEEEDRAAALAAVARSMAKC